MKINKSIFVSLTILVGIIILSGWLTVILMDTPASIRSKQKDSECDSCQCAHLIETLNKEIVPNSKSLIEYPHIRFIGCPEKDALQEALVLTGNLGGKKMDIESSELIYQFSHDMGLMIIQELYKDDIHIIISLVSNCPDLPFDELQYISPNLYNDIEYQSDYN